MDGYIDEIREHAQRLEAVGHHVDDDDLVFYTLNGLPKEEFKQLRTAIGARGGDIAFEELTTILHSEESRIHKEASTSAKVFVAASKILEIPKTQVFDTNASSVVTCFLEIIEVQHPNFKCFSQLMGQDIKCFNQSMDEGLFIHNLFQKQTKATIMMVALTEIEEGKDLVLETIRDQSVKFVE
ncbi:uncharacterized protein LOC131311092 [Rhododendron vialii]|uniref:uncharacterized protein LOC131311092 n=1 Tax=Rhododendron vialii TaxID=182163 RepID=UPI00265E5FB6|nr:uncharacterized protein LOC131311092 [Rhododendron vialii]